MAYKVATDYTFTAERETGNYGVEIDTAPIGLITEDLVLSQDADIHDIPRAWGYRADHESTHWQDTFSSIPTAQSKMVLTQEIFRDIVPGLLQANSDYTAASNIWKMFTGNYGDLPSPKTTNDGYYYDLVRNSPVASDDEKILGAIMDSATISISPTDDEGVLMLDSNWIGKTYERGATQSGTVSHASLANMYKWGNIATVSGISYGSADLTSDFIDAQITISSGAKKISDIPDGEIVFPKWEVEATVKVIANSETEGIKSKVLSKAVDTAEKLTIAFGTSAITPAADADLILTMHAYPTSYSSDFTEGEIITFVFKGVFGDTSAEEYPLHAEFFIT